ncbi:response regulator [Oceaniglobus roseus]|uniref:response regulator n=1 Tax=Oceaniglobus roseus TaxID=1737570 RepID=UPI000C7F5BD6|nr:response regulator [Kandeliimicrobium roseum]
MKILIVGDVPKLTDLWASCLRARGASVTVVACQDAAIRALQSGAWEVLILNLSMRDGSALAVADFASYRYPDTKIIPVTSSTFFSDGSVFRHVPNACTSLGIAMAPEDMATIVEHYGMAG